MEYVHVETDDVESVPDRPCELRRIGEQAGLERCSLNRYVAAPGEQLPLAYHYHDEQEEAFYVVQGTLHVETPEREYEIPAGDLFAVQPGNPHRAFNPEGATEQVTVVAVGAPNVSGEVHAYEGNE